MSIVEHRTGRGRMRRTVAGIRLLPGSASARASGHTENNLVTNDHPRPSHRRGFAWRLLATAAAAAAMAPAVHATNFTETSDFSNDPAHPTLLGALAPGSNLITGAITTYGSTTYPDGTPVGPNGELTNQDMDYVTFTVPTGYALTQFVVSNGTTIMTSPRIDRLFLGLASGSQVVVNPSFTSAAGLLGWTLVSQAQLGTDILPAIGASAPSMFPSVPGATTFAPPLGAGTYTLWLYDGDGAVTYSFNAVTAAVPEPGTWMLMMAGFGLIGAALRGRRPRAVTA